MDGLSGAASGIAVVSLAIQLGDGIKKLCDFWDSVKEAPDDVRAITADLKLLSSVLAEIASEEQHFEPDPTLETALKACCDNVTKLVRIANDMEPGFASKKPRIRIWTAFRAAIKGESIQKSQKVLEGLKSTLTLALHNHHNRLNRIWHQSQQQDMMVMLRHLSSLNLEQAIAFRDEAPRVQQTVHNPTLGVGFEVGRDVAIRDVPKILSGDQSRNIRSPPNSEGINSTAGSYKTPSPAGQRTRTMLRGSLMQTFFGTITSFTRTRVSRPGMIVIDDLADEEYPYEHEESLKFLPAGWLLKLGFNCAYNFSVHDSSTQGWQFAIKSINLVPNDSPIFQYCRLGNTEKVRDLMSRNLASVRDVDSKGQTALHFAARARSSELCRFLIEAGADKSARTFGYESFYWNERTPLREVISFSITQDGLDDAIDTCRIFDDCYDFWDEYGVGWAVLTQLAMKIGGHGEEIKARAEFYGWFVQSSRQDIKAYYSKDRVPTIICDASTEIFESIGLLLELGPPGTIDGKGPFWGKTPLIHSIEWRHFNKARMLLALGADPHHSCFVRNVNRIESPLSLAMYSSWAFCSFRDALIGMNFHVEDFVRRELEQGGPLMIDGWRVETLSALLKFDFEPGTEPPLYCSSCHFGPYFNIRVQPYWQYILERIKNGNDVQDARSDTHLSNSQGCSSISDNDSPTNTMNGSSLSYKPALPDDQSGQPDEESVTTESPSERHAPGREEFWCIWCWARFKKTGRPRSPFISETSSSDEDDSPEDEFSPFLFNA